MVEPANLPAHRCPVSLLGAARAWIGGTLLAVVAIVLVRRIAGAMDRPPSIAVCLTAGIVLSVFACWLRQDLVRRIGRWPAFACVAVVACLGAAAISVGGTSAAGLLALWLPIVGESAMALGSATAANAYSSPARVRQRDGMVGPEAVIARDSTLGETALADPAVVQHLVRRKEASGAESISGYLRASFGPSQRTLHVHVPFCPPLNAIPGCAAEPIDGPPARVKVTQVLPQGARLEVRLDDIAATPQQVAIEFTTT